MINPLAALFARAEFKTAALITRSVERLVGPIRVKSQEIVGEVVESATRRLKAVVIMMALGLFAAAMATVALAYALSAAYLVLLPRVGPVEARLIMAGAFAAIALIAVLVMALWPKGGKPAKAAAAEAEQIAETAAGYARQVAAETKPALGTTAPADADAAAGPETEPEATDVRAGFEAIIAALGEAGFRREQAGLRAGLTLANQLKPTQVVALALIGGFVAGLRTMRRRRRR